jgi:hypothetical protein
MYSWQHCGTGTLSYRQPRRLVIMDQWNGQQRAVSIKMFYMFGFFKSSRFLCHLFQGIIAFTKVRLFPSLGGTCVMYINLKRTRTETVSACQCPCSLVFLLFISNGGESNGKLPLRTCPECSVPEPCRSPDWALVPAKTGPRAEY